MFSGDLSDTLIVIPCLNEEAHLPALLHQLCTQSRRALIVVADGGSTDGSRAIVAAAMGGHANLRLIHNPARIQSAAVNRAVLEFGEGRQWLVRVDAHCLYPDDYAARLRDAADRTGAQSIVVPMVTTGVGCFQRAVAAAQNSALGTGGSPHRHLGTGRFVDHGHHALMAIAPFRAVSGYDESFTHNEDAELDRRLTEAGVRIWLEPTLALTYFPRGAPGPLFRQYFGYGRGRARTLRKHRARPALRQFLPALVAPALAVAIIGGPFLGILALPALAWAATSLGAGVLLAIRACSPCVLASGPAAMIMHLAWSAGFWKGWTK